MLPAIQTARGFPVASLGIIGGVPLIAGVITELALGPLADRGHERAMLVAGVGVAALSLVGSGLADSVALLASWRALEGVAFGLFVPAASAIIIRVEPTGVGERLARLQVMEYAGFAAGPFLGALLLAQFGATTGLVIAGLGTSLMLPIVLGVQTSGTGADPLTEDTPAVPAQDEPKPSRLSLTLLRSRAMWVALILSVAANVPVGTYASMWAKFLADRGATPLIIAVSFGLFTLPFMVLAPMAGRFVDRVGPLRGAVWGTMIAAAVVWGYGVIGSVAVIVLATMVESVGEALNGPGTALAAAVASGPLRAGAGQGLARSVGLFAAGVASFASGWVYATWGARVLFGGTAALMAALAIAGWFAALRWAPEFDEPVDLDTSDTDLVTAQPD
jgi:MFS family permease